MTRSLSCGNWLSPKSKDRCPSKSEVEGWDRKGRRGTGTRPREARSRERSDETQAHLGPPEAGRGGKDHFLEAGGSTALSPPCFLERREDRSVVFSATQLVMLCHNRHRKPTQPILGTIINWRHTHRAVCHRHSLLGAEGRLGNLRWLETRRGVHAAHGVGCLSCQREEEIWMETTFYFGKRKHTKATLGPMTR